MMIDSNKTTILLKYAGLLLMNVVLSATDPVQSVSLTKTKNEIPVDKQSSRSSRMDVSRNVYFTNQDIMRAPSELGVLKSPAETTRQTNQSQSSSQYGIGWQQLNSVRNIANSGVDPSSRLLGLSTTADNNIQLGLQFTVPFLSFPTSSLVTTSADIVSQVSVRWREILLVALLALGATMLLPWMLTQVTQATRTEPGSLLNHASYARSETADEPSTNMLTMLTDRVDSALSRYGIDSTSCLQRVACHYVQKSAISVQQGQADSTDLLITGLASNGYMASLLKGYTLSDAISTGRQGQSCTEKFNECSISKHGLYRALAKYLAV